MHFQKVFVELSAWRQLRRRIEDDVVMWSHDMCHGHGVGDAHELVVDEQIQIILVFHLIY
jgi:hypothetical protein